MMYDQAHLDNLHDHVQALLPQWGLTPAARLSLLTISENATYLAQEDGRRWIIRVHRPNYHSEAEIRSELAWIHALLRDGTVQTPRPVPTVTGAPMLTFADRTGARQAVAFDYMPGREPDVTTDLPFWFRHLGGITARLHRHAQSWSYPADFTRKRWSFDTILGDRAYWGDWRQASGLDPAGRAVLERTATRLAAETAAYGQTPDRFGLVHCDLRAANLLVEGDRMVVIDFDDCGLSWFAYDFAASVSFIEHDPILPTLMEAWLAGYRTVAPFPEAQAKALPIFVMLRRLQLTAWIASHAETPTAKSMGSAYTQGTVALAEAYLSTPVQEHQT